MLSVGDGGGGGGYTVSGSHGARSAAHEIRMAFLSEIILMSLADNGQVKVWKGSTVGAPGTVSEPGR